jgi:hypothetical protein
MSIKSKDYVLKVLIKIFAYNDAVNINSGFNIAIHSPEDLCGILNYFAWPITGIGTYITSPYLT